MPQPPNPKSGGRLGRQLSKPPHALRSMKRFCLLLIVAILAAVMLPARAEDKKIKVLLVTGGHGFEVEPFFKIFADNPEIAYTPAKHGKAADVYDRDDLLTYDVAVLYDMPKTITE